MATGRVPLTSCVLLLSGLLVVSHAVSIEDFRVVDRIVDNLRTCAKIPKLSLAAISLDDSTAYSKAYPAGHSSGTAFCIGGGTQAFTAVLLAKLIDENENVTWDTPIQDILQRRVSVPGLYRAEHLNLKDIFAMRSGMAGMEIVPVVRPYSREELVRNLLYAPTVAGFRERYVHNEVLFALIEDVVEEIGGDSWYNLLRLHILQPLKMSDTVEINDPRGIAIAGPEFTVNKHSMSAGTDSHSGLGLVAPAAGLCTSADDMTKWFRFVLTGGMDNNNNQILRKGVLDSTYKPIQSRGNGGDPVIQGYRAASQYYRDTNALGWIKGHYRGNPFVSMDGALPGYQTLTTILPDRNVAVHVSFSGDNAVKNYAAKTLLNVIILDLLMDGRVSVRDACKRLEDLEKEHPKVKPRIGLRTTTYQGGRDLQTYTGGFRNYAFGDIQIRYNKSEDDNLFMDYGMATFRLMPTHINDTFKLDAVAGTPLWYTTHTDLLRDRLFAEFSSHPEDPDHVESLVVEGFDLNVAPEFSRNPRVPEHYDYPRCGSCKAILSLWCLILAILGVCLR